MPPIFWEVRGSTEKPLLHLWSEELNLTRRVLAISEESTDRVLLSVEKFGNSKPDRLEFVRPEFERDSRQVSREEFCRRLRGILTEQFADETIETLTVSADLEHSLSGNYIRGLLTRGSRYVPIIAVPFNENSGTVESSLTFGLLWLSRVRASKPKAAVNHLRLIVPKGAGGVVGHRKGAIDPGVLIELYELDAARETLEKLDSRLYGNLEEWLVPQRDAETLLGEAKHGCDAVISLAPSSIVLHPSVASREVTLRHRGLPFARWCDQKLYFGVGKNEIELGSSTFPSLKRLVKELERRRNPDSTETAHQLYRAQPERWLEWMVSQDVTRIDASFDARFVYSQVFANSGGQHGILDLLTVTRDGRLAIIELKANEYIHLPIQAADYWLRIKRQLAPGNISRYGYFPKVELQNAAPLVYLVAPALRFHPATDELLKFLSPEISLVRVGLGENWRKGLRVVIRQ
jgi:hypothetical protein